MSARSSELLNTQLEKTSHRRLNVLENKWVLVCPNRAQRPWQGAQEKPAVKAQPEYDPNCYLCPQNVRIHGTKNPDYSGIFVFENDFPTFTSISNPVSDSIEGLLITQGLHGKNLVVCFSPKHNQGLVELGVDSIQRVIEVWKTQAAELSEIYAWVQIFENKGEIMGCSNPHPHCQIWASDFIPQLVQVEAEQQQNYFNQHKRALLADYAKLEQRLQQRVVLENEHWLLVVPFWAAWPFETLLLPKIPICQWSDLQNTVELAEIMHQLVCVYDALFSVSFPYSMGWHPAPNNSQHPEAWRLHAHYYPPLLRSATEKKFMVGYEMLAEAQRDLTPEKASLILQEVATKLGI